MKSKDAEEILSKENKVVNQPGLSFRPFVPTVDGDILNLEPKQLPYFLKKTPLNDSHILMTTLFEDLELRKFESNGILLSKLF